MKNVLVVTILANGITIQEGDGQPFAIVEEQLLNYQFRLKMDRFNVLVAHDKFLEKMHLGAGTPIDDILKQQGQKVSPSVPPVSPSVPSATIPQEKLIPIVDGKLENLPPEELRDKIGEATAYLHRHFNDKEKVMAYCKDLMSASASLYTVLAGKK